MNTQSSPNYLGDENIGLAKAGDLIFHARYNRTDGEGFSAREVWTIKFLDLNMRWLGSTEISTGTGSLGNPLEMIRSACSFAEACAEAWQHGNEHSENRENFSGAVLDAILMNSSEIQMLALELTELASSIRWSHN